MAVIALTFSSYAADAKKTKWVDASNFTAVNKGQDDGLTYRRLNVKKYPDLTMRLRHYFGFPTGMALRFRTDSPVIKAKWEVPDTVSTRSNGTAINTKGLDLYIKDENGKWLWAGVGTPKYIGKKHSATIVNDMAPGMKECMLYLPLYNELEKLEIGVADDAVIESDGKFVPTPIVAMGSSYTHGSAASRPGMAWPAQLSRRLGVNVVNYGTSGICKLEPVLAQIIADTDAEMFIFDGFSNPTYKEIQERLPEFVRIIREKHPTTPLVFLATFYREKRNFDKHVDQAEAKKMVVAAEEMKKLMAKDKNIYFINPGLYAGSDHENTVDGTHPSDIGYKSAVDNMEPTVRKIMKKYGIKSNTIY